MTPRDRDDASTNRKQQILEEAAALFAESGYYKTTTADVARAVGVTQPYVFHFFKSKETLYLAVLEQATQRIMHAFHTAEAPPERLMGAMGEAFKNLLDTHRNEILLTMTAFTTPEPSVRDYARQEFDRVYELVKERFRGAGIPDPEFQASVFFGLGMVCVLAETLSLPKLLPWQDQ
ncbi:TetR/AcrR family transcriptional regulator [Cohnella caldifontis]|uniref:TetR/AcrR family transcriptional regulator n=1 Tax=Cohnella caldifontis TaxID=3027471 RepID=UPI0023EB73B8|nr:TetR/AcrR family transcriptional regulator [Cohnella sp. YIM B05605]